MKLKRKIKNVIILILIVIVAWIAVVIVKKALYINQSKMLEIVIGGIDNLNYSYISSEGREITVVGKKAKIVENSTEKYANYETGKTYTYYTDIAYTELYSNNGITDMQYYKDYIEKYFSEDSDYNYSYEGKKDGFLVVKFKAKSQSKNISSITFYINKDTGLIEKSEYTKTINTKVVSESYDYGSGNYLESEVCVTDEIISYKDALIDTDS